MRPFSGEEMRPIDLRGSKGAGSVGSRRLQALSSTRVGATANPPPCDSACRVEEARHRSSLFFPPTLGSGSLIYRCDYRGGLGRITGGSRQNPEEPQSDPASRP